MENEMFIFRHYFVRDDKAGQIHYMPYVGAKSGVDAFVKSLCASFPDDDQTIAYTDVFTFNPYEIGQMCKFDRSQLENDVDVEVAE